ncbi:MAG: rRNA maturation RNase YbeY [Robiginitalea sp.]|uniref:rRNA maturation RNase YbeY n=1 Tax=Robiginitalea sp. TaxID=1902411 RepID=UPI003C70C167
MGEIAYHYQTEFSLKGEAKHTDWIIRVVEKFDLKAGILNFIFVSDEELLEMNRTYLGHDYFTDIITFEYEEIEGISGDLFVSTDRVLENANDLKCDFEVEIRRVMAHGVLHLLGYKDKSKEDEMKMRNLEEEALELFHVKHNPNV